MQETGWLRLAVEFVDQDLTEALATHEAAVAGLRRLLRAVKEMRPGPLPGRLETRDPVCA